MMDKVRVHEIAKELGINSKEVVDKAAAMGLVIKTASSSVSMEEAEKIMKFIMSGTAHETNAPKTAVKEEEVAVAPVEVKVDTKAPMAVVTAATVMQNSVVTPEVAVAAAPVEVEIPKRSGLKIVKKVRPVEEVVVAPKHENVNVSQYGKVSAEVQRELEAKKGKNLTVILLLSEKIKVSGWIFLVVTFPTYQWTMKKIKLF